jgi:hypothetical protein
MCQDGGLIWECDESDCGRAVCSKCIEIPAEEMSKLEAPNVKFKCVRCHWPWEGDSRKNEPYLVSALLFLSVLALKVFDIFTGVYN